MSFFMTGMVVCLVGIACIGGVSIFANMYLDSVEENAITNSDQVVLQVESMVSAYLDDMDQTMEKVCRNMSNSNSERDAYFRNLIAFRNDVEAIMVHSGNGELIEYWSKGYELKEQAENNLSYIPYEGNGSCISTPHVQNLFRDHSPWVVTFSRKIKRSDEETVQVSMDILFDDIASYVDGAGIGNHGYCYIADREGNIIYHPQQQLIYDGPEKEAKESIPDYKDGTHTENGVIYTAHTMDNTDWRIIGVSYVDELIDARTNAMARAFLFVAVMVILTAALAATLLAKFFSRPAQQLAEAMKKFETEAESFAFYPVKGSAEIDALSESFGHMVLRIQELMEKVRNEEITLRKAELNALQAQINPHFLYNTLDSIAWMCEMGRTGEAIEMVNSLARLFRISISKGHELITIDRELKHAQSYLKIQKFRYKSHFTYEFRVEEECLKYYCNKITLQPLIENSIVHGLDMSEDGRIVIEVAQEGDDIKMTVSDNGVGMTQEQCQDILRSDNQKKGGIGIKNVNDRIRIYFGEQYGVSIFSEPDEGTTVQIRMPKVLELAEET